MDVDRRALMGFFLSTIGCAVAKAPGGLIGEAAATVAQGRYSFPEGVASADPLSDGFVIWTRVEGPGVEIALLAEIFEDDRCERLVAKVEAVAMTSLHSSVRILVRGLAANRHYFYRFSGPDGSVSRTGRSRTAPQPDATAPLRVSIFSCQDYEQGHFHAYRHLIERERGLPLSEQSDFILHVGDFIYETVRGPDTRGWPDLDGRLVATANSDGSSRRIALPSGGRPGAFGYQAPSTLDDYRALYRAYLRDPDLQDARASYPFVQIWDDHEIFNDVWQSFDGDTGLASLRLAGNQAWFEFVPAALSLPGDPAARHAHDFRPAKVADGAAPQFDENFLSCDKDNVAAIGSMTIYRSLLWGRTAELFLLDGRSYRSPKLEFPEIAARRRELGRPVTIPPKLVLEADKGREGATMLEFAGKRFANPRQAAPAGTMLGKRQREWLTERMKASSSRWKLLGLNVGLMRFGFDDRFVTEGQSDGLYWLDGWDGYPTERRALGKFLAAERIGGVVSLTGDRHMHAAGLVYDDFDGSKPKPVAVELVGASVSAPSRLALMATVIGTANADYRDRIACDGLKLPLGKRVGPAMDGWMLWGEKCAKRLAESERNGSAMDVADPKVNPHLAYVDSSAFGYVTATFDGRRAAAEFVTIAEPLDQAGPVERRRLAFDLVYRARTAPGLVPVSATGERMIVPLKTPRR